MSLAPISCHVQIRNRKTNPRIGFGVLTERITQETLFITLARRGPQFSMELESMK